MSWVLMLLLKLLASIGDPSPFLAFLLSELDARSEKHPIAGHRQDLRSDLSLDRSAFLSFPGSFLVKLTEGPLRSIDLSMSSGQDTLFIKEGPAILPKIFGSASRKSCDGLQPLYTLSVTIRLTQRILNPVPLYFTSLHFILTPTEQVVIKNQDRKLVR